MNVVVDCERLEVSTNNQVTGVICLELNSYFFPERQWSDFPVVILSWWAREILRMLEGEVHVKGNFMDGPFSFSIEQNQNETIITFLSGSTVVYTSKLDLVAFIGSLTNAIQAVLDELGPRLNSPDLVSLKTQYRRLREMQ